MPRPFLSRLFGFSALLAAACLLLAPRVARAQQLYFDALWINHVGSGYCGLSNQGNYNCALPTTTAPDGVLKRPIPLSPQDGNISNEPHIEFAQNPSAACVNSPSSRFNVGVSSVSVCNSKVFLCAKVGWSNKDNGQNNPAFAIDYMSFEVFKFGPGSNPLDPASTPPLRTFFVDNPGLIPSGTNSDDGTAAGVSVLPTCVLWDGSINIQGEFGRSNGQYGFRAKIATNKTTTDGNINIEQIRAYPSANTKDTLGNGVPQKPIVVDVVDLHVVRDSPTVVGDISPVAAQPINISYRLAKDATMYMTVHETPDLTVSGQNPILRTIVAGLPRTGEGVPSGTLQNGDSWNGRLDNGDLTLPGVYLLSMQAVAHDQWGFDLAPAVTRQISLDPLQITDIRVAPLSEASTSLAVLSYMLTEPATTYIDIYPPGTQFSAIGGCTTNPLNDINKGCQDQAGVSPKNLNPRLDGGAAPLVRHIEEQKDFRRAVISFWDGRDASGRVMPDGDYVFAMYAALPSQNGRAFLGNSGDKRIWSSNAKTGFITISRGLVTISQVGPSSSVIGSSPSVAGLDPFNFTYSLSREAFVSLKIFSSSGTRVIKTLVDGEVRPGNFLNRERWYPPTDDQGLYVSSGTYLVELTAVDPFFPQKVSTTTALFSLNLFRIVDVLTTPLLTSSTDVATISYQFSQSMQAAWNIYPPGTVIANSSGTWPPCSSIEPGLCAQVTNNGAAARPIVTIKGMRPGRLRITEFWDGRNANGLYVPDGSYVFTLTAQSTTTPQYFASDRVMGTLTVARGAIIFPVFNVTPTLPQLFNSSQTISLPPYEVEYSMTRQSSVTIQILNTSVSPAIVRTLISGQVRDANAVNREFWDARDGQGNFVEPGFYTVQVLAQDLASTLSSGSTAQQTISVNPLRIFDVAVSPLRLDSGGAAIAYQVSETMRVAIKIYKPGTSFDGSGNPSPPESTSLVRRIVGVRPARTEVTETWDGRDEKLSLVPDGNYLFRVVASTDISAISNITGDVSPSASLAEDLIIAEIPVVRGGSADPAGDFEANTFVYPNPIRAASATFQIYVPVQAKVSLKIYNIAGEMVLERDFGQQAADSYVRYSWAKTNHAGRSVAHGVYFALIREEPNKGEKTPLQTVKKILIP